MDMKEEKGSNRFGSWILDFKFGRSSMNKCETSVVGNVVLCHVPRPRISILFLCGIIVRSTQKLCSYQICMCWYEIKQFCEQCWEFHATFYWKVFIQPELFSFNGVVFPPNFHVCQFLTVWNTQVNWNRRDGTSSLKATNSGDGRFQQGNIFSKNWRGKK